MPTNLANSPLVIFVLMLMLLSLVACSNPSVPEESDSTSASGSDTVNYKTCEGFLTREHVEDELATNGLEEQITVLDLVGIAGLGDSGATANCQI